MTKYDGWDIPRMQQRCVLPFMPCRASWIVAHCERIIRQFAVSKVAPTATIIKAALRLHAFSSKKWQNGVSQHRGEWSTTILKNMFKFSELTYMEKKNMIKQTQNQIYMHRYGFVEANVRQGNKLHLGTSGDSKIWRVILSLTRTVSESWPGLDGGLCRNS